MAKTKSGVLYLTKTERKEIETLMLHARIDIGYEAGGTYNYSKGNDFPFDAKEAAKALKAMETLKFILESSETA